MMTAQRLQILPPQNALARLRIIADRVVSIDRVLRIQISSRRGTPMRIQCFTDSTPTHDPSFSTRASILSQFDALPQR